MSNNVYTFDFNLKLLGKLENIAKTEKIFATRYVGNRLYMVTFIKLDPFFVIFFRDSKFPVILGELKITGYSNYLHPFDGNTIIGLGREATSNGYPLAIKIGLFDVSDL